MRNMIVADNAKGEVTIPVDKRVAKAFIECILRSGYSVKTKGCDNQVEVTIRRDN